MELDFPAFAFIMTLAAVVNGLGIVHLLGSFAEYLKRKNDLEIAHYWVFNLWIAFQFLLHILLWWSLWNAQAADEFTFLHYLYLLSGPILLYLGTSLLTPGLDGRSVNMRTHFYNVRVPYFTIITIFWFWVIFLLPALTGKFAPAIPFLVSNLAIAIALRLTVNPKIHAVLAISI